MHNLYRLTVNANGEPRFYWFTSLIRADHHRRQVAKRLGLQETEILRECIELPGSRRGLADWLNENHGRPVPPRPFMPPAPRTENREHPHPPEPGTATPDARDLATPNLAAPNPTLAGPAADLI